MINALVEWPGGSGSSPFCDAARIYINGLTAILYIHKIPHLICMGLKPSSVAPKIVETTFGHGGWWAKWPRGWYVYAVEMSYGQLWPPRWTEITPLSPSGKAGTIYWILMLNLKINGAKPLPPPLSANREGIVSRSPPLFDDRARNW